MAETSAGTVYAEILPSFDGFRQALRIGLRANSVGADKVEIEVDVDRASLARAGKSINTLTGHVNRFTLASTKSIGKVTALTAGVGLATSGIARFGAALAPAAGALAALPAIAGGAAVAIGTLKLGLMGVSDALEAGLTGDTEKYGKALAQLAPAAQATVRQIVALKPAFDRLKKSVQQELFTGLAGQVRLLGEKYLPLLQRQLPPVAASLSVFAENFTRAAASGPLFKGTNAVLENTASGLAKANNAVGPLTNALGNLLKVGAPLIDRLGAAAARLGTSFADMINRMAADGTLSQVLEDGIATLRTLGDLLGNVGSIIGSIFSAANTAGGSLLQTLADLTGRVADFFKSMQGAKALNAFFSAVSAVGQALGTALGAVLPALGQAVIAIAPSIPPLAAALAAVVVAVTPLIPILGELVVTLANGLTKALQTVLPYLQNVIGWIVDHKEGVKQFALGVLAFAAAWKVYQVIAAAVTVVQTAMNIAMSLNPIGLVVIALVALVAALVLAWKNSETFRDVVTSVWNAIKTSALWVWDNVLKPTFDAIVVALKAVGGFFTWLWQKAVQPAWTGIKVAIDIAWAYVQVIFGLWQIAIKAVGTVVTWLWTNAVKPVLGWVGDKFSWLWNSVVKPVMGWIGDKISDVWNKVIKPVFEAFRDFIDKNVAPKFRTAVDGLGKIWERLQDAAKKPISFIIDTVLNNGLLKAYNWLAKKFGVKPDDVHVANPFSGGGSKNNDRETHHDFASGGVLPGYTPGRDVHSFYSPTAGTLNLSGGEGILRPEVVKALGAGTIHAMNANARKGRSFALGGILPDFGGILDKVASFAKSPKDGLNEVLNSLLGKVPGAKYLVDMASAIPKKLVGGLVDKLGSLFTGGVAGGKINVGGSGVQRWAPIVAQVLSLLGAPAGALNAVLTRIRIESGGNPNAINLWDSNARAGHPSQGLMQTIPGTFSAYAGPFRGRGITDPLANIYAGVNYAMHRYGKNWINVMTRPGGYDNGGWLPPGTSMVQNNTGQPEAILNPRQWAAVERGITGGGGTTVNINYPPSVPPEEAIIDAQRRYDILHAYL